MMRQSGCDKVNRGISVHTHKWLLGQASQLRICYLMLKKSGSATSCTDDNDQRETGQVGKCMESSRSAGKVQPAAISRNAFAVLCGLLTGLSVQGILVSFC